MFHSLGTPVSTMVEYNSFPTSMLLVADFNPFLHHHTTSWPAVKSELLFNAASSLEEYPSMRVDLGFRVRSVRVSCTVS